MDKVHGNGPRDRDGQDRKRQGITTSLEDLGNFCLASGEFTTAIEYFSKLLAGCKSSEESRPRRASLLRRLATCYTKIGKCDHALELLDKAFMLVTDDEDPIELARIIGERGWVHFKRGEYDLSQADLESCLDILLGDDRGRAIASTYNRLGSVLARKGEVESALDLFQAALSAARLIKDPELTGNCLNNLGLVCKYLGRWSQSQTYHEEALSLADEVGQHMEKGLRLSNLGIIYSKRGYLKKAYRCWTEAMSILVHIGNVWDVASVRLALGHYHLTFHQYAEAEEFFACAMKESSENGDARTLALSLEAMGDLHFTCGRIESAHRCYLESLELAEEIAPHGDLVAEVKRRLADVEVSRGSYEVGMQLAGEALEVAQGIRDVFEQGCAQRSKACAEFHLGEWEVARVSFNKSIDLLSAIGDRKELAMTYLKSGDLLATQPASCDTARSHLTQALSIFEDLEMSYEAGLSALWLGRVAATCGDVESCHGLLDRVAAIFDGDMPGEIRDEIGRIEREADERVSCLSVSESNGLASFNSIVGRVLTARGQAEKLDIILDSCVCETGATRGLILSGHNGGLKLLASKNVDGDDGNGVVSAVDELLMMTEASERPVVSTSIRKDGRFRDVVATQSLDGAVLCVPLVLNDEGPGCIYLDSKEDGQFFTRSDVEFVVALTGILKSVLSEAKLGRYVEETRYLRSNLEKARRFQGMITQNRKMLEVMEAVEFLCRTSTTVLIEGETGTGKEMLARAIHSSGDRKDKPFVTIDCSALSNELLESELFGHIRGAFTDAKTNKTGLFESADGGTVFLDEVGKTSRKFQERLLQVVDKREFKPVGSTQSRKADFRLICATNRDMSNEVASGRFMEDLYYRLKVISLRLPPLRERRDDIPLLAEHFLGVYCGKMGKAVVGFSAPAMDLLVSYSWAGNVRQLEHEVERAVTFAGDGDLITPDLFSDELSEWGSVVTTDRTRPMAEAVQQIERQMIKEAMRRFSGNKTRAAKSLGLSRRGLLNKIQRYHLRS
ncbi:MAG: sigma 54-interacting transcriptional regulator [Candidatus Eisenbacteria bacterium]